MLIWVRSFGLWRFLVNMLFYSLSSSVFLKTACFNFYLKNLSWRKERRKWESSGGWIWSKCIKWRGKLIKQRVDIYLGRGRARDKRCLKWPQKNYRKYFICTENIYATVCAHVYKIKLFHLTWQCHPPCAPQGGTISKSPVPGMVSLALSCLTGERNKLPKWHRLLPLVCVAFQNLKVRLHCWRRRTPLAQ